MAGFELDEHGDIVIENNTINLITGVELLQQKVWTVLQTNLGEWFCDPEQGIDFDNLLGKGINAELVRFEIERGLAQVASTFTIAEFAYSMDRATRKALVYFKAKNEAGTEVGGEYTWG